MKRIQLNLCLVACAGCVMLVSATLAQTGAGKNANDVRVLPRPDADIPAAALLTEEGQELALQLQQLRRSLATMGANHPSMGVVRSEIVAVKQQLATYAVRAENASEVPANVKDIATLSDDQLRELVVKLTKQIEQLERRVFVLERRPPQ